VKLSLHRRAGAVALTGALALTLAACGSDDPTGTGDATSGSDESVSTLSGELNGAGASSQEKAMDAWRAGFQSGNPDVTVNYDPVGSGGGRTQFLDGAVQFAGTDSALSEEELATAKETCSAEAIDVPVYVSPIAVVFNLEGVTELNLSATTIAGIFEGTITSWDAPEIVAENPDVTLPAVAITPVHRSDESGTTKNFTDWLGKASGGAWAHEADGIWPVEGGESAQGTSGVIQTVQGGNGTVTYADESAAGSLGKASIQVGEEWVAPSADAVAVALDASPRAEGRSEHDIVIDIDRETTESGAYPLFLVSYAVACLQYEDAATADLVKGFLGYIVSEDGQAAAADAAGSAPLSSALAADAQAAIEAIAAA
jgi:phosphate transport system substrate-binding protein